MCIDVLKTRLKRPRKRNYRASGIRDILLACKDVHLDKQGLTVDWNSLIKNYDIESQQAGDEPHVLDDASDSGSETGSMDGLGKDLVLNRHLKVKYLTFYVCNR
jgi:hypothetical protein